jgi:hypothetical protein
MPIEEPQIRDLIAKREAAEKAVAGTEPSLKEKAFEVVFQHLLTGGVQAPAKKRSRRRKAIPATTGEQAQNRPRKPSGVKGYILELVEEGFFDGWRSLPDIQKQLEVRGHIYKQERLSPTLLELTKAKVLRRERTDRGDGRKIWVYERFDG